jgi:hypothetical protein
MQAPSTQQIADQLDRVLRRSPDARLIGIHAPARRAWPDAIERGGRRFRVLWSESALSLREALAAADGNDDRLVVLTNLADEALGTDLLARFHKTRLLQPNIWQMLRAAFQARDVDPRLAGEDWLVALLLNHAPTDGYPPVPGGVLDADTAWRHLLARTVGLDAQRPDVEAVLAWTLDASGIDRFLALPKDARDGIAKHLERVAGSAVGVIMGAVARGHGRGAVPLGLVLRVVFAHDTERELRDAAVRLEPIVGHRIDRQAALRLASAAEQIVGRIDRVGAQSCQTRAAEWLERLHIDRFARLSDHLAVGFEQRLADAAGILRRAVEGGQALTTSAEEAVDMVLRHRHAHIEENRAERARMALRLVRWLRSRELGQARLAESSAHYAREGAFVDLARSALFGGDNRADVSAVYDLIADRAGERRERENESFARALEDWNRDGAISDDVVPVEQFLDRILVPVARASNVLLIVLDGLSFAVYRALYRDLTQQGWVELVPDGRGEMPPLIAALPSVTQASRTSLLTGRLVSGNADDERQGFALHPGLVALSRAEAPPLLFHKGGLGTAGGLTDDVRDAIADQQRRVVGIVHNAVDAQLNGSDQLDIRWSLDDLRYAHALLRQARETGRTVVLAADHGHVLDHNSTYCKADGGSRWRRAEGAVQSGELIFERGRVLLPAGERRVVLPWSERIRYGAKSRGYHGGATPQEIVAPLAVLSANNQPQGWVEAPPIQPEWWERRTTVEATAATDPRRGRSEPRVPLPDLFSTAGEAPSSHTWIDRLLASPTYAAQRRLAGRIAPNDQVIAQLLHVLDERGGRLSHTALAQAMRQPVIRMSGLVSAAARVLNVDQARVLNFDRATETVTLDCALLELQFELGKA